MSEKIVRLNKERFRGPFKELVCGSVDETITCMAFPFEHWARIRTNNVIERLNRKIRRRSRVVGACPNGSSALMPVCARLRHVAGTQ